MFVYLPPGAELRGGAWVVVDSAINPHQVHPHWMPHPAAAPPDPAVLPCVQGRLPAQASRRTSQPTFEHFNMPSAGTM